MFVLGGQNCSNYEAESEHVFPDLPWGCAWLRQESGQLACPKSELDLFWNLGPTVTVDVCTGRRKKISPDRSRHDHVLPYASEALLV